VTPAAESPTRQRWTAPASDARHDGDDRPNGTTLGFGYDSDGNRSSTTVTPGLAQH
jgi:YD repeat-containing protein